MAPAHPTGPPVVALLLVLAGCSAGIGDAGTPTERPVTAAPVPSDRPTDAALPPGVSAGGVTDAELLEAAHVAALSDTTFRERARTTIHLENGSLAIEETYVGRHGRNATRISLRRNGTAEYALPDRSLVRAGVWGNASFAVRRVVTAHGRVILGAFEGTGLFYRRPRGGYGLALREARTSLAARRAGNGSVAHVVVAEGVDADGPWYFRRAFMRLRGDGDGRVVVTPAGAIRRFVVEFPVRVAGRNATLRHVYTVDRRNVTVTRPEWFEAARAERTRRRLARAGPGPVPRRRRTGGRHSVASDLGSTRTTSGAPVGA